MPLLLLWVLLLLPNCHAAETGRDGDKWTVDSDLLALSLDATSGALSVTEKTSGATYHQPLSTRDALSCGAGEEIVVRRATGKIEPDGRLGDWARTPLMPLVSEADSPHGPRAAVGFRWDAEGLYALFVVADDRFHPGSRADKKWQQADAVWWWAGWDQVGVMLDPADPAGFLWGDWKPWSRAAVRRVENLGEDAEVSELLADLAPDFSGRAGYVVESATAPHFITLQPMEPGRRFRMAFGVNDVDEAGEDPRTTFHPAGYRQGRTATYAVGLLVDERGRAPAPPPAHAPCGDVAFTADGALAFTISADMPEATVGRVRCEVALDDGSRDLRIVATPLDGWEWGMPVGRGFLPSGAAEYVAAYYGNGILIPADDLAPPVDYMGVFAQLDLPAVGVLGGNGGALCILQDHDHMAAKLGPATWPEASRLGMVLMGETDKGKRLPAYRLTWYFSPGGGLPDLAARLRRFCEAEGWVRPLREKAATNPNVDRLIGAANVWGSSGEVFAREAAAAGLSRLLVNGSFDGAQVRRITDLGYLCGEYDQYVDVDDATEDVAGVKPLPAHIRVQADGELAKGWLTLDGKHQFYSRCSQMALAAAQQRVPRVLRTHPYNARFMDVHTAIGLQECYSEAHPCTASEDRQSKVELLRWMREQGLVMGGEHGRAWSAPVLDYQEGMMSCNHFFSWPAGHLVPVDSADEISPEYLEYGIGYERRVPFWELVFHDCVVSTWYWGDTIGYLERVRPDLTDRKVALTALYGTQPMFWASSLGLGFEGGGKGRLTEAYRNCCNIHRAVGYERMVSHEYLSPDRAVQRTAFSDGTTVTVNFGATEATVESAGERWTLAENGIVADGPGLHQHVAIVNGRPQTAIEAEGYRFLEARGQRVERGGLRSLGPLTARVLEPGHMRLSLEPRTAGAELDPTRLDAAFDKASARLVTIGTDLRPGDDIELQWDGDYLVLPATGRWATFDLLYGARGRAPDVAIAPIGQPLRATQGEICPVPVELHNRGADAADVTLSAYWEAEEDARQAGSVRLSVPARGAARVTLPLDTSAVVGVRELAFVADSGTQEFDDADNRVRATVAVVPVVSEDSVRRWLTVDPGDVPRTDAVVQTPVDFTPSLQGRALDPASVAVVTLDARGEPARALPAQFEPAGDFDARHKAAGTLLFVLEGETTGPASCLLLARPLSDAGLLPATTAHLDPETHILTRETYQANIADGAIRPLSYISAQRAVVPMIGRIVFSSAETGWGEEGGELQSLEVLAAGPVRTVVRTVKKLAGEQVVTRTYAFYADYFTVEAAATQHQTGLLSRVWYAAPGTYRDDAGHVRDVDGKGKDEGVTGDYPDPKWYSVRNDDWAHACIALSPMAGQSYWDEAPSLGQLGFSAPDAGGASYAHIVSGPGVPEDFARQWHAALTTPIAVELRR